MAAARLPLLRYISQESTGSINHDSEGHSSSADEDVDDVSFAFARDRASGELQLDLTVPPDQQAVPERPHFSTITGRPSLKTRLYCMWNNALHRQVFRPHFSEAPIWVLGQYYHDKDFEVTAAAMLVPPDDNSSEPLHMRAFNCDVYSRFFFPYRQGFPQINQSDYTTDIGWGCLFRAGQMMLAHALCVLKMTRDWRYIEPDRQLDTHRSILRLFDDQLAYHCPFSIHHLINHLVDDKVKPGDWLSPSQICRALTRAINERTDREDDLNGLRAVCTRDAEVVKSEIELEISLSGKPWCPVIIFIPLRLGIRDISPVYELILRSLFTTKQFIGFVGGRPRQSLYFIGCQGPDFLGLDPHICRTFVNMTEPRFPMESFHCVSPRKIPITSLDPTLSIAFLCQTREDLEAFYALPSDPNMHQQSPLYTVCARRDPRTLKSFVE
eukprot:m.15282 g.15282  ORF g.15282 m.15282 type:complete len:440 (+) comp7351_c0_seq2:805-2124(+)